MTQRGGKVSKNTHKRESPNKPGRVNYSFGVRSCAVIQPIVCTSFKETISGACTKVGQDSDARSVLGLNFVISPTVLRMRNERRRLTDTGEPLKLTDVANTLALFTEKTVNRVQDHFSKSV
jgi:hypothetical protein